jgi:3'-phosphoadenosine 5'-phosphosulfate (PAPS) 3'-phosphatase
VIAIQQGACMLSIVGQATVQRAFHAAAKADTQEVCMHHQQQLQHMRRHNKAPACQTLRSTAQNQQFARQLSQETVASRVSTSEAGTACKYCGDDET